MKIMWENWLIESHMQGYGYVLKRRFPKSNRWKAEGYYAEFKDGVKALVEERLRTETADCIIDATDSALARAGTAMLVRKIDAITAEVLEGLDGA